MSDPFVGEIRMFASNFAPQGWAFCNGQTLAISQNTALFSLLGTTYGGNGTSTFQLPDLRSRAPVHQGQGANLSPYNLGQLAGAETVNLTQGQLPAHTHSAACNTGGGTQASPSGGVPAVESTGTSLDYTNATPNATMSPQAIGPTGSGLPVSIIQPVLAVSFIIALEGIYPSRN